MSKTRMVNTRFWSDSFVVELNPLDRYLFLYLLTNEHTNISGVYELPLKRMANETGIDADMLPKMIARLKGKVFHVDGWIGIKNFQKHQSTTSVTVKRGIEIEMEKIPPKIKEKLDKLYGMDTLSGAIIYPNLNSNTNLNKQHGTEDRAGEKVLKHNVLGEEIIKSFEVVDPKNKTYYGNTTQRKACDFLLEEYGLDEVLKRISVLPKTNKIQYFPSITTPVQLRDKWVQLQDAADKKKSEFTSKGRGIEL